MTRDQWKRAWRQLRIIRRESYKATMDLSIFGRGVVKIGPDIPDGIRHVPFMDFSSMAKDTYSRMAENQNAYFRGA